MQDLKDVLAIARTVGWGAAEILRSHYRGESNQGNLEIKDEGDGPVTVADVAANQYILDELQVHFRTQDFGYLSEETYKSHPVAPSQPWIWLIDPLDGTRDFIDGTGEYAVHIALVHEGRPVLAVVAWPEAQKLYYANFNCGAFMETRDGKVMPVQVSSRSVVEDLTLVVSRTHRGERLQALLRQLPFRQQHSVGSVGCKIATIVEQRADVYISLSGHSAPKDWDLAAPELILTEAGGRFTHFDGTPLKYNRGDVNQWGGLLASNGHRHTDLCRQAERILAELDSRD